MFTRVIQRKRPRRPAVVVVTAAIVVALLSAAVAFATVNDSGTYDLTVADKEHETGLVDLGNASAEYIGSSSANQASGTGLFDPFVRLQGSPTEQGFNTDAAVTFDTKTGKWTHAIKVNAIPVVSCDDSGSGPTCWELFVDINDSNTAKRISLNDVQIWFTDSATATDGTGDTFTGFDAPASLEYHFSGDILINDVNQGSGRGDLRYLVPTADHTWNADTYFVLYSKWGTTPDDIEPAAEFGTGGYSSDGGFEEWKVRKTPNVSIVKTADASSVNAGADIGFTITVTNTGVADATGVTVSDPLPAGTGVDWSIDSQSPSGSCSISGSPPTETLNCGPLTLAADGGSLTVHVTSHTAAASCGTYNNTASFTADGDLSGSSTASVTVNCAAIMILKQSTKTDNPLVATAGAVFSVKDSGGTTIGSVTDNSTSGLGDEDPTIGEVCVSGLAPGTYTINETTPPSGYGAASQTNVSATAANGTNCGDNQPTTANAAVFTNAPLGEIEVIFRDLGSGETSASIVCQEGTTTVDAESENGQDDPALDDTDETFTNLPPGTYTCTVVIDP